MGFTHVNMEISNVADPQRHREIALLADTGAMLSVIPASVLERLGIQEAGVRRFRGFAGVVERRIGGALFRYQDFLAFVSVIFGDEDDTPVLGVTALESLGYQVDPVTQQLRPTEMLQL